MANKTVQKRTSMILSILISLALLLILPAASVFAASSEPEGAGKEDPNTKLKLYEEAKEAAEDTAEEVVEKAEDVAEEAAEKAEDVAEEVKDAVEDN